MTRVLSPRSDTKKKVPTKGQTLRQFLAAHGLTGKLDEVALANWATKDPAEINRALIEIVGCEDVKPDPLDSVLDPALGALGAIFLPQEWKPDAPLALEKTHTIKLKKRLPMPAIGITKTTAWFLPKTGQCEVEYALEGVSIRADKVDFEVHATAYFAIGKGDAASPSDTCDDAGSTHVFRRAETVKIADPVGQRRPPSPPTITWKGESEATKGVLKKESGKEAHVTHACAPYTVHLRYYKDDADKKAKLTLEPFAPRWKAPPDQADLVDESLVVKWKIEDDQSKLKLGQLLVFDKAGAVAFRAALDEGKLRGGSYDLLKDAKRAWPRADVKRSQMPYRVQIQAHSDEDEEGGLAIAVMPTVVRAFDYAKVQFIAFNIKPGTRADHKGRLHYLGDPTDDVDIATRCDIMKDAIRTAHGHADANADTLKIFMAPEFYFRGSAGGYPVEKLSKIPELMRQETDKFEYVDWLFVMGTAIGYLDHEQLKKSGVGSGKALHHSGVNKHNVTIDSVTTGPKTITVTSKLASPEASWKVTQGKTTRTIAQVKAGGGTDQWELTLDKLSGLAKGDAYLTEPVAVVIDKRTVGKKKQIKVRSKLCSRIPKTVDSGRGAVQWIVDQGLFTSAAVTKCVHDSGDDYWLTLSNKRSFDTNKSVTLIEPVATEVFNIAQVQRGWPSPALHHGLTQALVDKESVSAIDYLGKSAGDLTNWFAEDAKGRVIDIHGTKNRTVLPTEGGAALLGASPNKLTSGGVPDTWVDPEGETHTVGSEVNKSGIGGGGVVTFDGITFGIEVCLDHMCNRLAEFYKPNIAAKGDPKVQVLLIPSWGMSIGGGELVCPQDAAHPGLVFNVDGSRCASDARATDTSYSCDDHPAEHSAGPGHCGKLYEYYVCTTCNRVVSSAPGTCSDGHAAQALVKYLRCVSPKLYYGCTTCAEIKGTTAGNCDVHTTDALDEFLRCASCKKYRPSGSVCGCGKPGDVPCGEYYPDGGACSQPPAVPAAHGVALQQLGEAIATSGPARDVPSANAPNFFAKKGQVQIYAVKPLPPPAVVT